MKSGSARCSRFIFGMVPDRDFVLEKISDLLSKLKVGKEEKKKEKNTYCYKHFFLALQTLSLPSSIQEPSLPPVQPSLPDPRPSSTSSTTTSSSGGGFVQVPDERERSTASASSFEPLEPLMNLFQEKVDRSLEATKVGTRRRDDGGSTMGVVC